MRPTLIYRVAALVGIGLLSATAAGLASPGVAGATSPSHALIQGTGSTWSANAVNQWISDVTSSGLQVVFTNSGSAQGRKDFANRTTDFAVTDIGYQGKDPKNGDDDTNCIPGQPCRAFAYEPIVAGGTSFPYQVKVAGKLVRNLRLSGETIAKIFTYKITNWNDPAITADNNGRKLPSLRIIPVEHSEGSGSTAQFTTYLNAQYPSIWQPFNGRAGFTEYFPPPHGGQAIQQSGSDGVMNFVSSQAANGAIGYDEYSYPLAKGFPVAKLLNKAGYYTLPDEYNVAVALQHAKINLDKKSPDYLLQDLRNVFVAPEKQAYAMSSYSYFLIPTASNDTRMTTAKRQTLADYLYFAVCQGQQEMGPIGYSPLPINLVQASFAQTAKLKTADPKVDLTKRDVSTCHNPTFVAGHPEINHLAKIAPVPPSCDKQGDGPCTVNGSPSVANGGGTGGGGSGGGGSGNGGTGGGGSGNGAAGTGNGSNGTAAAGPASIAAKATGKTSINPDTGQVVTDGGGDTAGDAQPVPAELAAYRQQNMTAVTAPLAVLELLAVLVLPPVLFYGLQRRRRRA
jgi:phosphate transport system substrate-binding protein